MRRYEQILFKVGAFQRGWVTLSATPTIVGIRKLVFLLLHSEDPVILSSFVWIGYMRVTDERTDRRTDRRNCCRY